MSEVTRTSHDLVLLCSRSGHSKFTTSARMSQNVPGFIAERPVHFSDCAHQRHVSALVDNADRSRSLGDRPPRA
jgi:hypothetical protein